MKLPLKIETAPPMRHLNIYYISLAHGQKYEGPMRINVMSVLMVLKKILLLHYLLTKLNLIWHKDKKVEFSMINVFNEICNIMQNKKRNKKKLLLKKVHQY